jgi:acetyltransferase-like isoleucine patch superfamily enzyme
MNLFEKIYLRYCIASGFPYGAYLKKKGEFRRMGDGCYIAKSANITDPYLTCLGSNVWVTSGCQLICHDASVIMLNIMHREHFDRVAPVTIGDNVFLGNNAIVLPGVAIGTGCIIGAGAVITRDIPAGSVCAGNPARIISSLEAYVEKIAQTTQAYPWYSLLHRHAQHVYDPENEQLLRAARIRHFFGDR